jgi:hypothetical protein
VLQNSSIGYSPNLSRRRLLQPGCLARSSSLQSRVRYPQTPQQPAPALQYRRESRSAPYSRPCRDNNGCPRQDTRAAAIRTAPTALTNQPRTPWAVGVSASDKRDRPGQRRAGSTVAAREPSMKAFKSGLCGLCHGTGRLSGSGCFKCSTSDPRLQGGGATPWHTPCFRESWPWPGTAGPLEAAETQGQPGRGRILLKTRRDGKGCPRQDTRAAAIRPRTP